MPLIQNRYSGVKAEEVTSYVVNRKDILHLDNLYLLMHEWLVEHNYVSRSDSDFPERYYLHKEGGAGKEMWWRWRPQKDPFGNRPWTPGSDARWRFDMDIDAHVLTLKDVEAVIGGKKYKAHQGEVEVMVRANLIQDPEKAFEKGMFKDVKKLVYGRLWSQQKRMLEEQFYKDAMQFRDALNTFLTIETYLPTKEWPEFWPKRVPEA